MDIDERKKIAFDHAANVVKQVLTLSTAIVIITAAAARFIFVGAPECSLKWLILSWVGFILSIVFGVMGLMSLSGNMEPEDLNAKSPAPTIYNRSSRILVCLQLSLFLVGIILVAIYGYSANP